MNASYISAFHRRITRRSYTRRAVLLFLGGFALFLLAACQDNDEPPITPIPGVGLTVLSASGAKVPVEGTWVSACESNAGDGRMEIFVYSGFQLIGRSDIWIGDITCSGPPDASDPPVNVTISVVTEKTVGWDTTPPGTNPANVAATVVEYSGGFGFDIMFVDDNVSPFVMYSSDGVPVDLDGHPTLLRDINAVVKQF